MTSTSVVLITLGASLLDTVFAGEYCPSRGGTQYCGSGCCKEGSNPCCIAIDGVLTIVYIIVGVVGGLILLCLVGAVICCYISNSRRRQRPGIVVGQQQAITMSTVQHHTVMYQPTNTGMYPQSPMVPGTNQQPPPYQPQPYTPPPGYQTNPQSYQDGFSSTGNQTTEKQDPTI